MRRRAFLGTMVGGMAAMAGPARGQERAVEGRRPPNVVYVFADEHRWQSMSFTELPQVRTPHMERMAREGVEFTHCISNYPVCSPYRAMLMSGMWPYQTGVIDNNIPLDPNGPALGKAFRAAGYRTGYIGKWHLGGTRAESFGFDQSLIWTETNTHWDKSAYHPPDGEPVRPKGYNATLMTDQAIAYITENRDEPFFLMLSINPPHADFLDAPAEKKALYPEGSLPFRPNVDLDTAADDPDAHIARRNEWRYYQGYHAHISAVDDELGRIIAKLEELGLAEDTILVYSSDHGSMFGSHGVGSKRQPYEESIRVPFMVWGPGRVPRGRKFDALLGGIDKFPTLCGLAGISGPASCRGQDFSPWVWQGRGPDPESQFIMHISKDFASGGQAHPAPIFRGVRTKRHMYAVGPDEYRRLYDLAEDPYQLRNLAGDPAHDALAERLHALTREWVGQAGDPFEL